MEVHETGRRKILSIDVGQTAAFPTESLRGLVARGLGGVQLSDPTPTPD
jgi:transposase-like protein